MHIYCLSLGHLPGCLLPAYRTPLKMFMGRGQSRNQKVLMLCRCCSSKAMTLVWC